MFDGWGEDLLRSLSFRSHIREVSKKRNTQFWLIFLPLLSVECVNVKEKGAIPFLTLLCSLQFSYGKLIDEDSTTSESIYFIIKVSSRSEGTQCLLLLECLFVGFKPVILTVKRYHMTLS